MHATDLALNLLKRPLATLQLITARLELGLHRLLTLLHYSHAELTV
jgi:hypothetical protein